MDALVQADTRHLRAEYEEWRRENPNAFALIARYAQEAERARRRRGEAEPAPRKGRAGRRRNKYGIRCIAERARWHADIEHIEGDFSVNNDVLAYAARALMEEGYVANGFFDVRELRSE